MKSYRIDMIAKELEVDLIDRPYYTNTPSLMIGYILSHYESEEPTTMDVKDILDKYYENTKEVKNE